MLATITWVADRGIELGPLFIRYYQLFFFLGFFLGFRWMKKVFKDEGIDLSILDALLSTMVVATVVGADWVMFSFTTGATTASTLSKYSCLGKGAWPRTVLPSLLLLP